MEISNDTLFMFAIILLFFCLMKDRPCNVEGLDSGAGRRYRRKLGRNPGREIIKDFYNLPQQPGIDYSRCGQKGEPCIPCRGEENLGAAAGPGCEGKETNRKFGPEFNINSYNGGEEGKRWYFTKAEGVDPDTFQRCGKYGCGIICDSRYASTPPPGVFPDGQNGMFCRMGK